MDGVGSFEGEALLKAGEETELAVIMGAWNDGRGSGRIGRAKDGVVTEDLTCGGNDWRDTFDLSVGCLNGAEDCEGVEAN
jgi:hypothetical protein